MIDIREANRIKAIAMWKYPPGILLRATFQSERGTLQKKVYYFNPRDIPPTYKKASDTCFSAQKKFLKQNLPALLVR